MSRQFVVTKAGQKQPGFIQRVEAHNRFDAAERVAHRVWSVWGEPKEMRFLVDEAEPLDNHGAYPIAVMVRLEPSFMATTDPQALKEAEEKADE